MTGADEEADRDASKSCTPLWKQEQELRDSVAGERSRCCGNRNTIRATIVNTYASLLIFGRFLISIESLVSIALSISLTVFTFVRTRENDTFDGSIMSWTLLSFAVITPMSASIGMAFARRERALEHLSVLKSTFLHICWAHAEWDWTKNRDIDATGRQASQVVWLEHFDYVVVNTINACRDLTRLLTLPNGTRARHRVTQKYQEEASQIDDMIQKLHRSCLGRLVHLTRLCEVLKTEGMPANEASRIRQWERMIAERIELLLVIKKYRTPQALRSFARLFTVFLPPFYAPFYGQMAIELNSLGMAITFSILTAVAMTSLFESISQMEDPFVGILALDGIDVHKELCSDFLEQLFASRAHFFPNAVLPPPSSSETKRSLFLLKSNSIQLFQLADEEEPTYEGDTRK